MKPKRDKRGRFTKKNANKKSNHSQSKRKKKTSKSRRKSSKGTTRKPSPKHTRNRASKSGLRKSLRQNPKRKSGTRKSSKQGRKKSLRLSSYNLCDGHERYIFFQNILGDYDRLKNELSTKEFTGLRFVFDIGLGGKKSKLRGHRVFRDLRLLEKFLNTSGNYKKANWSPKDGMCRYRKNASIQLFKFRGQRVTGIKTVKIYKIEGNE